MPLSNAERQARYRARVAGKLPEVLDCVMCGRQAEAAHEHTGLCLRCWRRYTPEGKADTASRVARWRERHRKD